MSEDFIPLREQDVLADPLAQFAAWFEEARQAGIAHPEEMAVATATANGTPSVRMVLMKGYDADGFAFFTNYDSRKGADLDANPRGALLFYWGVLGRQVRVEGAVKRTSRERTAQYVHSRARGSQLSAMASPQSQVVPSRGALEDRVEEMAAHYAETELPVPDRWGGYLVLPERVEFWQHRDDRLHDRLLYTPDGDGWKIQRLAP
ncbi:MAG: pyridoxamine 5-phosphate oxidase [Solirubrobacteraceae bacterium]|nr:pyridoxamine 5-phosphate oxidase [Solirubrobacteraceae bacterium]